MEFNDRLKLARKRRNITQYELADKAGITQPAILKMEKGLTKETTKLFEIAKILDVDPEWLKTGRGIPPVWLKGEHTKYGIDKNDILEKSRVEAIKVPLISLQDLIEWAKGSLKQNKNSYIDVYGMEVSLETTAAVVIMDESMVSPNRDESLDPGDTLLIDKAITAEIGDVVAVRVKDSVRIRRLSLDGSTKILKPNNTNFPILMADEGEILGVVTTKIRMQRIKK